MTAAVRERSAAKTPEKREGLVQIAPETVREFFHNEVLGGFALSRLVPDSAAGERGRRFTVVHDSPEPATPPTSFEEEIEEVLRENSVKPVIAKGAGDVAVQAEAVLDMVLQAG